MTRRARLAEARRIVIDRTETPVPAPGEVVVEVEAVALCGSDIQKYRTGSTRASVLGHEVVGRVVVDGGDLRRPERVAVHAVSGCGRCEACIADRAILCSEKRSLGSDVDGGLQELVALPEASLCPLPNTLDPALGTLVFDTVGTAHDAVVRIPQLGHARVAVFGLGPLGLSCCIVARDLGASVLGIGRRPYRVELARSLGFDALSGDEVLPTDVGRVDACIDATASPLAFRQAVALVKKRGTVVVVGQTTGTPLELGPELVRKELSVVGSWYCGARAFHAYVALLRRNEQYYRRLITHRYPFDEVDRAFALWADTGRCGKVVVEMGGAAKVTPAAQNRREENGSRQSTGGRS